MKPLVLQGCGTALVTPFTADGAVDYEAYARMVDRQVASGVDFLVPLATTGETPTLSAGEKTAIYQVVKEHAQGLPLMPGVGVNSLPDTLNNIRLLEPLGADALLVVVPYYNKPTQQGQYEYFKAVAAETSLPVINSSMTILLPASPNFLSSISSPTPAFASSSVLQIRTPFPKARPVALSTIGILAVSR